MSEIFSPYKRFYGFMMPNWLARRSDVSHGAKLCYGRLAQYLGRGSQCNPRESVLASELGIRERQCRRLLAELQRCGLIVIQRRGLGRSNSYSFPRHAWMDGFRPDVNDRPDRPIPSAPERTTLSGPLIRESDRRESREENPCSPLSGDSVIASKEFLSVQTEQIWEAYPKKVGRPTALRAIRQAIHEFGFEHILERTSAYAANPPESRYIPAPARFFRDQRFNDDPATWNQTRPNSRQSAQVTRPKDYAGGSIKI